MIFITVITFIVCTLLADSYIFSSTLREFISVLTPELNNGAETLSATNGLKELNKDKEIYVRLGFIRLLFCFNKKNIDMNKMIQKIKKSSCKKNRRTKVHFNVFYLLFKF